MNTVDHLRHNDDIYDPDDVGQRSPQLKAVKFRLEPSLSPPPNVPISSESPESSSEGSPSRKGPPRQRYHPSQGDAVLVSFMAGGNYSEIAREAGEQPLASNHEAADEPMKGGVAVTVVEETHPDTPTEEQESTKEDDHDDNAPAEVPDDEDVTMVEKEDELVPRAASHQGDSEQDAKDESKENDGIAHAPGQQFDLKALAVGALAQTSDTIESEKTTTQPTLGSPEKADTTTTDSGPSDAMEGVKLTVPSITKLYVGGRNARSPDATTTKSEPTTISSGPPVGGLPPILNDLGSPNGLSNGNGAAHITLPSISDQLGDINHLSTHPSPSSSSFPQSPPGRPPPQFAPPPNHGSPPKSPNETFPRRELPSPGRAQFYPSPYGHRRPSQTDSHSYTSPTDYSGSNTETPSTDQSGSTPATMGIDRMSIDGITNPQIGGFQCTYPGCTASPFQTQYLLNSHANVHSSNRPHYCNVKGCPRSEGGKGFKRKNEMIRHGLVHDSPGYVCPFCPDREHKYPRPDNLQRHVRVHHVDKDKDDPQLRDVLSQRPEGPSRGRRRRGGTS